MAGNLSELNDIHYIFNYLTKSEDFVKLLYNKQSNPLEIPLPTNSDWYDLVMYKTLFPYMKVIDLSEEGADVNVDIYFGRGDSRQGTKHYKTNYMFVDIYVHNDLWRVDTGIRTYQIMYEIDRMLNAKKIPNINGEFTFDDYRAIPSVNTKYAGYGMIYHRVDSGIESGCLDDDF